MDTKFYVHNLVATLVLCSLTLCVSTTSTWHGKSQRRYRYSPSASSQRILENLSQEQLRKLLQEISSHDNDEDNSQESCEDSFGSVESKIIRTKDSLANGATFLSATPNIDSALACRDECCNYRSSRANEMCDVAVYQVHGTSDRPRCFLFSCYNASNEFSCFFSTHDGYATYQKNPSQDVDNSVEELQDIAAEETHPSITTSSAEEPMRTTSQPLQESTTPTKQETTSTTTSTTQTTTTTTTTQVATTTTTTEQTTKGVASAECARDCSRFEWRCDNHCCISLRSVCDGTPHCSDGSDEVGCPTTSPEEAQEVEQSLLSLTTDLDESKPEEKVEDKIPENTSSEDTEPIQPNVADVSSEGSEDAKQPEKNQPKEEIVILEDDETTPVNPEAGAVLPLAIGLAVTGCVLIMVACRIRVMKKKLRRRGRPLTMDESDYLINGMYL